MSEVIDVRGRHLLRLADFTSAEILYLLDLAAELKAAKVSSRPGPAAPITVLVREQTVELHPGARHTFSPDSGRDAHR